MGKVVQDRAKGEPGWRRSVMMGYHLGGNGRKWKWKWKWKWTWMEMRHNCIGVGDWSRVNVTGLGSYTGRVEYEDATATGSGLDQDS